MATQDWKAPEALQSYLTTELNALTDGSNDLGGIIDNETDRYLFINTELFLAQQAGARDTGAYVALVFLFSVDGTNYDMGADAQDPADDAFTVTCAFDAVVTARYRTKVNIPIPPLKFKILTMNVTGEDFAATLNTLKYRRHNGEIA